MATSVSLDRIILTPLFCQQVVVRTAPLPGRFNNDPNQDLSALGVVDDVQAGLHRARIQADLHANHFSIAQSDIQTGPAITVATSSDSVLGHAH